MSRISLSAFTLSLSLFTVLAGAAAMARDWDHVGTPPALDQPGHKEWNWDGNRHLSVGVPSVLHYQRSGAPRIVITGPEDMLRRLQVGGGHIEMDHDWSWHFGRDDRVDITVSGVPLDQISLGGSGQMLLGHLDQDALDLVIGGSGSASADGRVGHLKVVIGGSGKIDFAKVASADAKVTIAGSGNVAVAPKDEASVTITGSGEVRMQTRPAHMHSVIMGSGRILLADKDGGYSDAVERVHGMSRVDY
jgi:Putative auto-transporter adhesin, head GIN domain